MYAQSLQTETAFSLNCVYTDTPLADNGFATQPLLAIQPIYQRPDEEDIYTSFEQAISGRQRALHLRLTLVSGPLTTDQPTHHTTTPNIQASTGKAHHPSGGKSIPVGASGVERSGVGLYGRPLAPPDGRRSTGNPSQTSLYPNIWQRAILLTSLALMLLMSGFDLMGMLVLHAH